MEISRKLGKFPLKEPSERGDEVILPYRVTRSDSHGAGAYGVRTEENRVGRPRMRGPALGFESLGGFGLGLALLWPDLS